MSRHIATFRDRRRETEEYLDFLTALDRELVSGPPRLPQTGHVITATQRKMLHAGVYLQLYNLVEATMTQCIDAIAEAVVTHGHHPGDLSDSIRQEWVRAVARTHVEMNFENRLNATMTLVQELIQAVPISGFEIKKGGGGNWDDQQIENFAKRLGVALRVAQPINSSVKRPYKDDKGGLEYVCGIRNKLAHGNISFEECGNDTVVSDLRDLARITFDYMEEVVGIFDTYLTNQEYLLASRRGIGVATPADSTTASTTSGISGFTVTATTSSP